MSAEEKRILDDIKKTGHPLEIDVVTCLMQAGWSVFPEFIYRDERTRKVRAIDVVSFYGKQYPEKPVILVLECKTSEKPWVFYSSPSLSNELTQIKQKDFDFDKWSQQGINMLLLSSISSAFSSLLPQVEDWENKLDPKQMSEIPKIIGKFHYSRVQSVAHSCHVAFRKRTKEDSPDDFQKAIHQIKGACYQISQTNPKVPIIKAIVFRGKIFEYVKTKTQEKLKPTNHVLFSTFWFEPHFTKKFFPPDYTISPMVIDVIRDNHFVEYLDLLKTDMDAIRALRDVFQNE